MSLNKSAATAIDLHGPHMYNFPHIIPVRLVTVSFTVH